MVHSTPHQSVMLPTELVERAKRLIPAMRGHPIYGMLGRVSAAAVLRVAIVRGLESLESELVNHQTQEPR